MLNTMSLKGWWWRGIGKVMTLSGKLHKMTPEQIANFIDKATTCLVSSVDEEGFPQTRAMGGLSHREGIQKLYFSTNTSSQKVPQFKANEKASVYFYDSVHFV